MEKEIRFCEGCKEVKPKLTIIILMGTSMGNITVAVFTYKLKTHPVYN